MFITLELIAFLVPLCLGRVMDSTSQGYGKTKGFLDSKEDPKNAVMPTLNIRHAPNEFMEIMAGETRSMECEVGGSPPPTIHWLKDGQKISQSVYDASDEVVESILGLGFTRSKLILDCVSPSDAGRYTCVAENEYIRTSKTSQVFVVDTLQAEANEICLAKKTFGSPATIYMWTQTRLEVMGTDVQLFCRSNGNPQPHVIWRGPNKNALVDPKKYEVLPNGDLIIRKIIWSDMGAYTCQSKNQEGSDEVTVFLYPTMPENDANI